MQKSSLYFWIGSLLVIFTGLYSCNKKVTGVDNDTIIATPYSLYFGDSSGAVYNTNDGKTSKTVFQADGYPCRAICTAGDNIILIKKFLYYSTNNGQNFNLSFSGVTTLTSYNTCTGNYVDLNQSMILEVPDWSATYLSSDSVNAANPFGLALSLKNGVWDSWYFDYSFDTVGFIEDTDHFIGPLPTTMISFTRLADGVVCALGITGRPTSPAVISGNYGYQNYYKVSSTGYWSSCTGGVNGAPLNSSGTPLPTGGAFRLGHYNNQLLAIDSKCGNGVYYSNDTGRVWMKYPGIPSSVSLYTVCSPFEESCFVGGSGGLYVLNINTGSFQQVTNGLAAGIVVRGITYKENIYKSGTTQKVVYLATNKGIYQSTDGGNNWIMTIAGNYTAIY